MGVPPVLGEREVSYRIRAPHPAQSAPAKPPLGVMPRRLWDEQRVCALASAIARATSRGETCATAFHVGNVRDWAAEIVDLCERMEGGQ